MAGRRQGSGSAKDAAAITLTLLAIVQCAMAASYTVGGTAGWNLNVDFGAWAAQKSFKVGDTLVFTYSSELHSVFQVSEADYKACNLFPSIKSYQSGSDTIVLTEATTYYFVCGTPGHCTMGMAVAIPIGGSGEPAPSPAPTPSLTPKKAPAPAPSPKKAPAPAPASPSPSPISPSPETVPSPSPSETSPSSLPSPSTLSPTSPSSQASGPSPPKNGASSVQLGVVGLLSTVLLGGLPFFF